MPIGSLILGGGSLLGGLLGRNAAQSASKQQAQTAQNAINAQLGVEQTIQQQLSPWLTAGGNALYNLQSLLGLNQLGANPQASPLGQSPLTTFGQAPSIFTPGITEAIQSSPGYQFQLQQGIDAIQNSAAGKTGALSGNMLSALQKEGQGLAGTSFMDYLRNLQGSWGQNVGAEMGWQQQLYNMLSGLSSAGQNAATNQGSFAQSGVGNVSNLLTQLGNAQAAGTVGGANALSGGLNNALLYGLLANNNANNANSLSGLSPYLYGGNSGGFAPTQGFWGGGGFGQGFPTY